MLHTRQENAKQTTAVNNSKQSLQEVNKSNQMCTAYSIWSETLHNLKTITTVESLYNAFYLVASGTISNHSDTELQWLCLSLLVNTTVIECILFHFNLPQMIL